MKSFLDIFDVAGGTATTLHASTELIEAPNWSPDGSTIWFNGGGQLYSIPATGGEPSLVDTGVCTRLNNDHGISPDGRWHAISNHDEAGRSCIHVVPAQGGEPRRVTALVPSWWHGWSPDSARIAYVAVRGEDRFGIWEADAGSGQERLVIGGDGPHYDGPDYTPDGEWIWFNSDRGGVMKLWRVRTDGSGAQAMTDGDSVDWFPHPSPDGETVLYLAYAPGTQGHPRDRDVELRLMPAAGGKAETVVRLFGGQGSVNVPCWAPDSRRFAFMRYARD